MVWLSIQCHKQGQVRESNQPLSFLVSTSKRSSEIKVGESIKLKGNENPQFRAQMSRKSCINSVPST